MKIYEKWLFVTGSQKVRGSIPLISTKRKAQPLNDLRGFFNAHFFKQKNFLVIIGKSVNFVTIF